MEHAEVTWKGVEEGVAVEQPFEDFFEQEQDRLLRVLWMVTGSLQEAEDIVQDAFLRVWERWPKVSVMESPTGYLHHAAMNIFRNRYRQARLGLRKAIWAAPPIDAFGSIDDRISVSSAARCLRVRLARALVLTELLGYPADEAGRMLGVRASTVRSLSASGQIGRAHV